MNQIYASWTEEKYIIRKERGASWWFIKLFCLLSLFIFPAFIPWQRQKRQHKTNLATKGQKTTREPRRVLTFLGEDGVVDISKDVQSHFSTVVQWDGTISKTLKNMCYLKMMIISLLDALISFVAWKCLLFVFCVITQISSYFSSSDESCAARQCVQFAILGLGCISDFPTISPPLLFEFACIVWRAYCGASNPHQIPLCNH